MALQKCISREFILMIVKLKLDGCQLTFLISFRKMLSGHNTFAHRHSYAANFINESILRNYYLDQKFCCLPQNQFQML